MLIGTGTAEYTYWGGTRYFSGTGAVLVAGGTITLDNSVIIGEWFGQYGNGTLAIRDGGVVTVGASVNRPSGYGSISLERGGTLIVGSSTSTGSLNTDLTNNGRLVLGNVADISHWYTLTGSGAFNKRGSGTLQMMYPYSCTGTTTVEAGTLRITTGTFFSPAVVHAGAALQLDTSVALRSPWITLTGGTLNCPAIALSALAGVGVLDVRSGQVSVNSAISVADGGQLLLSKDTPSVVAVQSLAVSATSGGYIDVGRGRITIAAGGMTAADLRSNLLSGRLDGSWTGTSGIASTAAAINPGRAVGYRVLANTSAIVAFAGYGDCTLDGQVNSADMNLIINAGLFGQGGTSATWWQGDFNYDGMVDMLDISDFLSAGLFGTGPYNTTVFPMATGAAPAAITAVPEPVGVVGTAVPVAAAAWGLKRLRVRRRNC